MIVTLLLLKPTKAHTLWYGTVRLKSLIFASFLDKVSKCFKAQCHLSLFYRLCNFHIVKFPHLQAGKSGRAPSKGDAFLWRQWSEGSLKVYLNVSLLNHRGPQRSRWIWHVGEFNLIADNNTWRLQSRTTWNIIIDRATSVEIILQWELWDGLPGRLHCYDYKWRLQSSAGLSNSAIWKLCSDILESKRNFM